MTERYNRCNEYSSTPSEYRWVFNKLALSEALGYECGPVGEDVDLPHWYVVRPVMNLKGMGEGATIEWIDSSTDRFPAGYFWCERFRGEHLSVDYSYGRPVLCVRGVQGNSLDQWVMWEKVPLSRCPDVPEVLSDVILNSRITNIEFIGGRVIEVQFHHNADFRWGNEKSLPVYSRDQECPSGYRFVSAPDGDRVGLFIK